jgi:predicted lipoprotein with Yx(FWY)xxD motif
MSRRLALTVGALALAIGLAACGGGGSGSNASSARTTTTSAPPTTTAPASTTTTAAPASGSAATVKTGSAGIGTVLVDSDGKTLYAFTGDQGLTAGCTGGCASAWPPLMSPAPVAGSGVDQSKLAAAPSGQVAYNGHLLYRYSADNTPGQTNGQGIGGLWHAMSPAGDPIMT